MQKDLHPDISFDNYSHLDCVEGRQPHCWHQQQKKSLSMKLLVAWQQPTESIEHSRNSTIASKRLFSAGEVRKGPAQGCGSKLCVWIVLW